MIKLTDKSLPIPVFGVPANIKPIFQVPISLWYDKQNGFDWKPVGEPATKSQLEAGIKKCRGRRLPNEILPALDPEDVVILQDGIFWIDRDWELKLIDLSSMSIQELEAMIRIFQQILTNPNEKCWSDVINQFTADIEAELVKRSIH
jgi:hypothetical protein